MICSQALRLLLSNSQSRCPRKLSSHPWPTGAREERRDGDANRRRSFTLFAPVSGTMTAGLSRGLPSVWYAAHHVLVCEALGLPTHGSRAFSTQTSSEPIPLSVG